MFSSGYYLFQNYHSKLKNKLQTFNTQHNYELSYLDKKLCAKFILRPST